LASTKGCIIIDSNGKIQMRVGDNGSILPITAMCYWDGKLVVGCGSAAGTQGNLAYFDKTAYTDMGNISDSTYGTGTVATEWRSKMFDLDLPDVPKRLAQTTLVFYDNTSWNSMTIAFQYRFYRAVTGGTPALTSWASIDANSATIAMDVLTGCRYVTYPINSDPGYAFQFRVTTNTWLEIVGFLPLFDFETARQNY